MRPTKLQPDQVQTAAVRKVGIRQLIYINIFGFAVAFYWSGLTSILLPEKILEVVPESVKGTSLGFLTAIGSLILIFFEPVAGVLSDRSQHRFGKRRPFIAVGTIGMSGFLLLMIIAPNYWSLFASFVLLKVFWGFAEGTYPALLPDAVPESQRGQASGYLGLLQLTGSIGGVFVCGKLVANPEWIHGLVPLNPLLVSALVTVAIMVGCMLVVCLTVKEPTLPPPPRADRNVIAEAFEIRPLLKQRSFLLLTLSRTSWYFGFNTLLAFLLFYVRDGLQRADYANATGNLMSILYAAALPTILLAGVWSDRAGRRKPYIYVSSGLMLAAAMGFLLMNSYGQVIFAMAVWGLGVGLFHSVTWAMATESFPETGANARYLALWISISQGIPWLIGPLIGGVLLDHWGFSAVFRFVIVCFLIGLASFYWVKETGWRAKSTHQVSEPLGG